jgi:hypothetical protein
MNRRGFVAVLALFLLCTSLVSDAQYLKFDTPRRGEKDYSLEPEDAKHAPVWVGEGPIGHWECPAGAKYLFMQTGTEPLYGGGYLSKWPMPERQTYFGYGPNGKKPICLY